MQVPLSITYRGMDKSDFVDDLVRQQVQKLERVCDHIDSCRVALEKPHAHQRSGSGYRVRIDITMPPGHEIAITRTSSEGNIRDDLYMVVRDAFQAARRRVLKLNHMQRGDVKRHPGQEVAGLVTKLMEDYGFLQTVDGREIYFNANSVLSPGFDELRIGAGVTYTEELADDGPQASSVRVLDRRGATASGAEPWASEGLTY